MKLNWNILGTGCFAISGITAAQEFPVVSVYQAVRQPDWHLYSVPGRVIVDPGPQVPQTTLYIPGGTRFRLNGPGEPLMIADRPMRLKVGGAVRVGSPPAPALVSGLAGKKGPAGQGAVTLEPPDFALVFIGAHERSHAAYQRLIPDQQGAEDPASWAAARQILAAGTVPSPAELAAVSRRFDPVSSLELGRKLAAEARRRTDALLRLTGGVHPESFVIGVWELLPPEEAIAVVEKALLDSGFSSAYPDRVTRTRTRAEQLVHACGFQRYRLTFRFGMIGEEAGVRDDGGIHRLQSHRIWSWEGDLLTGGSTEEYRLLSNGLLRRVSAGGAIVLKRIPAGQQPDDFSEMPPLNRPVIVPPSSTSAARNMAPKHPFAGDWRAPNQAEMTTVAENKKDSQFLGWMKNAAERNARLTVGNDRRFEMQFDGTPPIRIAGRWFGDNPNFGIRLVADDGGDRNLNGHNLSGLEGTVLEVHAKEIDRTLILVRANSTAETKP